MSDFHKLLVTLGSLGGLDIVLRWFQAKVEGKSMRGCAAQLNIGGAISNRFFGIASNDQKVQSAVDWLTYSDE